MRPVSFYQIAFILYPHSHFMHQQSNHCLHPSKYKTWHKMTRYVSVRMDLTLFSHMQSNYCRGRTQCLHIAKKQCVLQCLWKPPPLLGMRINPVILYCKISNLFISLCPPCTQCHSPPMIHQRVETSPNLYQSHPQALHCYQIKEEQEEE